MVNNKYIMFIFISIFILMLQKNVFASSTLGAPWVEVSFKTTHRDSIKIKTNEEGCITYMSIALNGKKIKIPKLAYSDIRYPLLSDLNLRFFPNVNDADSVFTILEFPIENFDENIFDELLVYELVFENNILVKRVISKPMPDGDNRKILKRDIFNTNPKK